MVGLKHNLMEDLAVGRPRAATTDRWLLIPVTEILRKTTISVVIVATLALIR
jgi:hypothetical protein